MTTFDYVLGAICVCVLIYQIILMLRMQRTAVVRGKSINKKAVTLIILALLALALWRMEDIQNRWPVLLAIGGVCASFLLSGTALSKDGVFYGGRFMPYDRAEYYLVERADSDAPVLRLSRVTKEAIVQLTREQLPQALALLEEKKVPTREEYSKRLEKRVQQRQANRRKYGKKKKYARNCLLRKAEGIFCAILHFCYIRAKTVDFFPLGG